MALRTFFEKGIPPPGYEWRWNGKTCGLVKETFRVNVRSVEEVERIVAEKKIKRAEGKIEDNIVDEKKKENESFVKREKKDDVKCVVEKGKETSPSATPFGSLAESWITSPCLSSESFESFESMSVSSPSTSLPVTSSSSSGSSSSPTVVSALESPSKFSSLTPEHAKPNLFISQRGTVTSTVDDIIVTAAVSTVAALEGGSGQGELAERV